MSDVPIGLMLSGGLDSSAIASLAARNMDASTLTAYSVSFGRSDDESETAARLAAELGMKHRTILLTRDRLANEFDNWLDTLDYPNGQPHLDRIGRHRARDAPRTESRCSCRRWRRRTLRRYNRWMKYLRFYDLVWSRAPRGFRRTAGRFVRPVARGLAGDIASRAATGGDLWTPSRPFHDDLLGRTLGPTAMTILSETPPESKLQPLRKRFDASAARDDYLAWMSYASLRTNFVEDYLQRLDKMGMQHSVEGRVPLVDPRLVRLAFRLDQEVLVPGHRQKALFRSTVGPDLPDYIRTRPKQGFCPPTAAWAREFLGKRTYDPSPLVGAGLLPPAALDVIRAGEGTRAFVQHLDAGDTPSLARKEHLVKRGFHHA